MVARGGIEPPTGGFSVLGNLHPGTSSVTKNSQLGEIRPPLGDGRCSWVSLEYVPKWQPAFVRVRPKCGHRGREACGRIADIRRGAEPRPIPAEQAQYAQ